MSNSFYKARQYIIYPTILFMANREAGPTSQIFSWTVNENKDTRKL